MKIEYKTVEFLVDKETARVVIIPETSSGAEEDKRKLVSKDGTNGAEVSFGAVCNEFGFSGQDIEDSVVFADEENGRFEAPMIDMAELVERYGGDDVD